MNLGDEWETEQAVADAAHPVAANLADRWILSRFTRLLPEFEENLGNYRFDEASLGLYQFIWHEFCDWYIEMAKLSLWSSNPEALRSVRATLVAVLEGSLKMLHPIMPFITEEIWSRLPGDRELLVLSDWPHTHLVWRDKIADALISDLQGLVTEIRRVRHEFNIGPGQKVAVDLISGDAARRAELEQLSDYLGLLAKAEPVSLRFDDEGIRAGIHVPVGDVEAVLLVADVVDLAGERNRLRSKLESVQAELAGLEKRLANDGFVNNAPADVVNKVRGRRDELTAEAERLRQHSSAMDG
jgi:valyl-tRNA synthetase